MMCVASRKLASFADLRAPLLETLQSNSAVISAPTGSGKSTLVPRWLRGRVLVVQPRRVACRGVASRVAELEGVPLGREVGYRVRDDDKTSPASRVIFVTPGVLLRDWALVETADTVLLDEFHERRWDVDLLLALCLQANKRLVLMSATLDAERVAEHVAGPLFIAGTTPHAVDVRYAFDGSEQPDSDRMAASLKRTVQGLSETPGHVLVFLPGKAEIRAATRSLAPSPFEIIPLHGSLTLEEQSKIFGKTSRRKLILATNVAETSITVPGITAVIDSGLVRRTHYHNGRGYLTLSPIALDSATQRKGRAGRTERGVCVRLWGKSAQLAQTTPPEVHRDSLIPLVLAAAERGYTIESLPFIDTPKDYAVSEAREALIQLGALEPNGRITARGKRLAKLPIDPWYGRVLVEAERCDCLEDAIDLVASLEGGRVRFLLRAFCECEGAADELPCDLVRLVRALREVKSTGDPTLDHALNEAQKSARRLRRVFRISTQNLPHRKRPDRQTLLRAIVAADPRAVHVARQRKRHTAFSSGGTELSLARESSVNELATVEAIVVCGTTALGKGGVGARSKQLIATAAGAVNFGFIQRAGLGRERIGDVHFKNGHVSAVVERVYAKKVVARRESTPEGALLREAVQALHLRGTLFKQALPRSKRHWRRHLLVSQLARNRAFSGLALPKGESPPPLEEWLLRTLENLGLEQEQELALLCDEDLTYPDVAPEIAHVLDEHFPSELDLGACRYELDYDLSKRQVLLRIVSGNRNAPPPKAAYLPRFPGFRVCVETDRQIVVLTR